MSLRRRKLQLALAFRLKKERRRIDVEALRSTAAGEDRARGPIGLVGGNKSEPAARLGEPERGGRAMPGLPGEED